MQLSHSLSQQRQHTRKVLVLVVFVVCFISFIALYASRSKQRWSAVLNSHESSDEPLWDDASLSKITFFSPPPGHSHSQRLAVFYHVGDFSSWKEVVQEQLKAIRDSGLYEAMDFLEMTVFQSSRDARQTLDRSMDMATLTNLPKIHVETPSVDNHTEYSTLYKMWEFCRKPEQYNSSVLYFHLLGIPEDKDNQQISLWRRYLEYFVIHQFRQCVKVLEKGCVTCGANLRFPNEWPYAHYDGNYYWATCHYLRHLLDPRSFRLNMKRDGQAVHTSAQYWIANDPRVYHGIRGLSPRAHGLWNHVKAFSCMDSGMNHLLTPFPPANYSHVVCGDPHHAYLIEGRGQAHYAVTRGQQALDGMGFHDP